jgi:hypothetical protein
VYTDHEVALWDLSAVDVALSTAEVGGPAITLDALESVAMMEAQFCAAHPTRDAIALARPPSTSYHAARGPSTTAQSQTLDECLLVTVYDITAIDASASGGEAAPPWLQVIATAEVPQRTLTGVAFNSRLMAVVGGQQPEEVLLFAFTPRQGNGPQPAPLELTKLPRPLRVEAARYSITQPCVALDDRRLYYYYACNLVAIFDAQELLLESPGQTGDEAHNEGEEMVVVGQDWSHPALVAQLHNGAASARHGGRVGTSAGEAYAQDRTGVVSVVTAEAVRLLVDPCSSIGVQAGDSEDLLLFDF